MSSDHALGRVTLFPYTYTPNNWLACNGQTLHIKDFSDLFKVIGNTFGGDGKTTFALPNLEGKSPLDGKYYAICSQGVNPHDSGVPNVYLGQIILFATTAAPRAFAACKGELVTIAQNPGLYSLIGSMYGTDYGELDFALPKLDSKVPLDGMQYFIAMEGMYPPRGD